MRGENMGKKLITSKNLDEYISEGQKELIMDGNMIISPGVKDLLDDKKITIIYRKSISNEDIEKKDLVGDRIRKILKEEYNIEDGEDIKKLVNKIHEKL